MRPRRSPRIARLAACAIAAVTVAAACGGRDGLEPGAIDFGDDDSPGGGTSGLGGTGGSAGVTPEGGSSGFGGTVAGLGGLAGFGGTGGFGGSAGFAGSAGFGGSAGGAAGFAGAGGFGGAIAGSGPFGGAAGFAGVGGAGFGGIGGGFGGASGGGGGGPLGTPCSVNGALGCHGPAQRLTVRCDQGVWVANGTCEEGALCDRRSGVCGAIVPECVGLAPGQRFCREVSPAPGSIEDQVLACGPDLVTAELVARCRGQCVTNGMTATCAPVSCGDGIVQAPEQCDDGNSVDTDACTNTCNNAVCGDGIVRSGVETCDDGNTSPRDNCSAACLIEPATISAGATGACALGVNGRVSCWGLNSSGQLGLGNTQSRGDQPGEMGASLPTVDFGGDLSADLLARGSASSCARLAGGGVKCWGSNVAGVLGIGDSAARGNAPNQMGTNLPFVDLGSGIVPSELVVGSSHACAIVNGRAVKCWGNNSSGQLGLGDTNHRGDVPNEMGDQLPLVDLGAPVSTLSLGDAHTCALMTDFTVKCWGSGACGRLGSGSTANIGDAPGEMGSALLPVDLGTNERAAAIAAGGTHTCAVLRGGAVKCWGCNTLGRLGQGNTLVLGDTPGEMGDALPPVDLGVNAPAVAITAGTAHTCVSFASGVTKCFGNNSTGALGIGDTNARGDAPGEMGANLPAVDLGTGRRALSVSAGSAHTCALLDDRTIKCWGQGSAGTLGLGDVANRGDGASEMGDFLPTVSVGF